MPLQGISQQLINSLVPNALNTLAAGQQRDQQTQGGQQNIDQNKLKLASGENEAKGREASSLLSFKTPGELRANLVKRAQEVTRRPEPGVEAADLIDMANRLGQPNGFSKIQAELKSDVARAKSIERQLSSVRQREFEFLTKDLPSDEVEEAKRIRLGLAPRAIGAAGRTVNIGGVEKFFDPVELEVTPIVIDGEEVTAQTTAKSRRLIESNIVTARESAKNSAGIVKENFETIQTISKNIRNLDKAIRVLKKPGAKTGAIERFLPSITAAAVELDNIRKELGLDVVGGTTFGALSAGELALALDVALPTGLDEPELIEFLERRKAAQLKLSKFLSDGISFLGGVDEQGTPNTIAGFIKFQESKRPKGQGTQPARTGGTIMVDDNGNRARVFDDATFEEL